MTKFLDYKWKFYCERLLEFCKWKFLDSKIIIFSEKFSESVNNKPRASSFVKFLLTQKINFWINFTSLEIFVIFVYLKKTLNRQILPEIFPKIPVLNLQITVVSAFNVIFVIYYEEKISQFLSKKLFFS